MSRKIAITTTSFASYVETPIAILRNDGFAVVANNLGRKLRQEETLALCGDCLGIVAGTEIYDRQLLEKLGAVKVISRVGVGVENIDLAAARDLGIQVFNTPYGPTLAVAELTVGLILDLLRKVTLMHRELKSGTWKKRMGNLLQGKKVGIIGFGRIGQKVASLLLPFGVEITFFDVCEPGCAPEYRAARMDELLAWADIITLHCSAPARGKKIIGPEELTKIRPGAWLINTSRGGLVDEEALYHSLKENHLSGAALDVFDKEPYQGLLSELDNVLLTPHIGSYAKEGRIAMEIQAVENLIAGLKNH